MEVKMKNNIFKILIVGFLLITAALVVIAGDIIVKQGNMNVNDLIATGKVGIGTTSPAANLDFGNSITNKKLFIQTDGSTYAHGFGIANSELRIFTAAGGTNHISFGHYSLGTDAFTERMKIDVNGNVGIGTTTPLAKLHVAGAIKSNNLVNTATVTGATAILCAKSDGTIGKCSSPLNVVTGTCTCS